MNDLSQQCEVDINGDIEFFVANGTFQYNGDISKSGTSPYLNAFHVTFCNLNVALDCESVLAFDFRGNQFNVIECDIAYAQLILARNKTEVLE